MERTDKRYRTYVQILKEELVPAMGCTEPIAIAYAAAKAREVLGCLPDRVEIGVSDNIVKNVKSVIVPNTGGLKGIEAAAAAGIVAGQPDRLLEVIAQVTPEQKEEMKAFLQKVPVKVQAVDNGMIFDIIIELYKGAVCLQGKAVPCTCCLQFDSGSRKDRNRKTVRILRGSQCGLRGRLRHCIPAGRRIS